MTEFYEMFRRKRRGTALLSAESSLRALSVGNFVRNFLVASLPRLVACCSRRPWIRDQGAKWTLLAANYSLQQYTTCVYMYISRVVMVSGLQESGKIRGRSSASQVHATVE